MRSVFLAIALGGLGPLAAPVSAATFGFSFDITGLDYAGRGTFDGDLQGDGDTILNMSDLSVRYTTGGVEYRNTGNPLSAPGTWSLSGSVADWSTVDAVPGGMAILTEVGLAAFGDPDITIFNYDPGDFRISAVPLPAGLPLALVGMAAFGWLARRKQA